MRTLIMLLTVGCESDTADTTDTAETGAATNTCTLPEGTATADWQHWEPPGDCPWLYDFDVLESEAEFDAVFGCSSGLDWSQHRLVGIDSPESNPGASVVAVIEEQAAVRLLVDDPVWCGGANPDYFTLEAILRVPADGRPVIRDTCMSESECGDSGEPPP